MREPRPSFRKFDGWWYVQIRQGRRRVQVKFVRGAECEDAAYAEYHHLMVVGSRPANQHRDTSLRSTIVTPVRAQSVVAIVDESFGHCQALAPRSYQW